MGSNTIIAIVVGAILVIVGFSLWPVLNGASNSLYSYFRDSCDDGNGNRFLSAYTEDSTTTALPSNPNPDIYYSIPRQHGGKGISITDSSGVCVASLYKSGVAVADVLPAGVSGSPFFYASGVTPAGTVTSVANAIEYLTANIVNEQGDIIGTATGFAITSGSSTAVRATVGDIVAGDTFQAAYTSTGDFVFLDVAPMLKRFAGINNLLLTILPVVSIAGFLGISGAKLYSYGKGTASIGSSISTSVFTLIGIVVAMVIAGPIMGSAVDANQVVVSGQYQVNSTFGNIIQLLFAMIPVVYIAGLVTLVGLQARTALMGSSGGGGMG